MLNLIPEGQEPKAVVFFIHGMTEYIDRYTDFAVKVQDAGFIVRGYDLPGHGKFIREGNLRGFFAKRGGWKKVLEYISKKVRGVKEEYPDLPFIIFAHSMGSMLTRDWLAENSNMVDGVILSGTCYMPGLTVRLSNIFTNIMVAVQGPKAYSPLLCKLSNREFIKAFKGHRTIHDWVSSDAEQVDTYVNDPLCGFACTNSFYRDLTSGWLRLGKKKRQEHIRKDLPLYMFSGHVDPVGGMGLGVAASALFYKTLGMEDVHYKLYNGMRHEIIHEKDNDEVIADLLNAMNEIAEKSGKS